MVELVQPALQPETLFLVDGVAELGEQQFLAAIVAAGAFEEADEPVQGTIGRHRQLAAAGFLILGQAGLQEGNRLVGLTVGVERVGIAEGEVKPIERAFL